MQGLKVICASDRILFRFVFPTERLMIYHLLKSMDSPRRQELVLRLG
jgi:hypothetical protein